MENKQTLNEELNRILKLAGLNNIYEDNDGILSYDQFRDVHIDEVEDLQEYNPLDKLQGYNTSVTLLSYSSDNAASLVYNLREAPEDNLRQLILTAERHDDESRYPSYSYNITFTEDYKEVKSEYLPYNDDQKEATSMFYKFLDMIIKKEYQTYLNYMAR